MSRQITFAKAINECLHQSMAEDPNVIVYGLGVTDPKSIFGTTAGLEARFGKERVFDMPTAENAMTGVAIGAAIEGIRPVMVHQRLDFFLLAMDQLVNGAAKWRYMFGGQDSVPITIRLIMGRGWGQGPTHSQNLQAWFAHIPGLKVVMPASAEDAKGLLAASIFDDDPVLFLEHRWLHNVHGDVPETLNRTPLGKARLVREGDAVTIVGMSYMTVEAIRAADFLSNLGIHCEVLDLRTIRPLDWDAVFASVSRTGRLLALDTGHATGSVAGEIVARVAMECWGKLKAAPQRIAMPDFPEGTSPALTKGYHPRAEHIVDAVARMLGRTIDASPLGAQRGYPHDVPGDWFNGPF
ncbi:alpha-ketoacid dehydrogenase subunit beta [Viridibacterium curvum]|uniref:Transketolase C-terminal domain-containing protein n=1 Tax=Viridibacterium curvum TaxID=1101404 RepID=A0ABP9QL54_9RHOO